MKLLTVLDFLNEVVNSAGSEEPKGEKPIHIFLLKQQTSRAPLTTTEAHYQHRSRVWEDANLCWTMGLEAWEETQARCPFAS